MMEEIGVALQDVYTPTTDEFELGFLRLENERPTPTKKQDEPQTNQHSMKPERSGRRESNTSVSSSNTGTISHSSFKVTPGLIEWRRIMATQKEVILKDNTINSVTDIENNGKKEEDPQREAEKEPIESPDDECHKSVPDQEKVKPSRTDIPDVIRLIVVFHFPCSHTTTKLPRG